MDKLNELIPGAKAKARELELAYRQALAKEGITSDGRARHARVLWGEGGDWEIEERERARSEEDRD